MSQAVIGNLRVNLGIDTAQFAAGARQAQSTLAGLQSSLKGFGAAAVGALSLGAIGASVDQAIKQVAAIGDLAETIGITAEQVQVFNRLALESGASTDVMARGLQEIAEQSADANSKLSQLFAANGLSAQGREVNSVIRDFMTLLQNARDPAEQLSIATSVLGTRVGRELVEAFRSGAVGVDVATQQMVASGNFHTNAEVARLQEIEEEYNRVIANIGTAWQRMVVGMIEAGSSFFEWLSTTNDQMIGQMTTPEVQSRLEEVRAQLALKQAESVELSGRAKVAIDQDIQRLQALIALYEKANRTAGISSVQTEPGKTDLLVGPTTALPPKGSTGGLNRAQTSLAPLIAPGTIDDIYGAGEAVKMLSDNVNEAYSSSSNLTQSLSSGLASSLSDIVFNAKSAGEAMEMLKGSALDTLQSITDQLLRSGLNMLLGGLGGGFLGGFGGFYANGGTLGAGKWGIAGEAGPEIIHGPARITPMDGRRGGVTVNNNVVNTSNSQVTTRATQGRDGSVNIETLVEDKVIDTLGGGRAARLMGGRFGARIQPRRT